MMDLRGATYRARYILRILFFLPITFTKRVIFGKDPVWKQFFFQSWGIYSKSIREILRSRPNLWINTEAGGEFTQIFSLCKRLKEECPEYNLVVSTYNYNSYVLAKELQGVDLALFSPWDFRFVVNRVALDKQANTARFLLVLVAIAAALDYLFIRLGMGIEGVALGTVITYLLYYTGLLSYALRHYLTWPEVGQFFLRSVVPGILIFCVLFSSDALFHSLWPKVGALAAISSVIVWHTQQQTRFLTVLINAVRFGRPAPSS